MRMSIAIPAYEAKGSGALFLEKQFSIFRDQSFKDFEVVISDQSLDDKVKNVCVDFSSKINIKYVKNSKNIGNCSANLNNAILNSSGEIIKIVFQDDFLWSNESLEKVEKIFTKDVNWLVNACQHTEDDGITFNREFFPYYNHKIHLGVNTLSCPTSLTIRNDKNMLLFDDRLNWLMDVDYYKRLYGRFGPPKVLNEIVTVNRIWKNQLTNSVSDEIKNRELRIMMEKFGA